MDEASTSHGRPTGQVILSIAVVLLGTALAYGTYQLPEATGYAKVGPRLMSGIVSGGLLLLGFMLLRESLAGGFHDVDESEFADTPTHWGAFAWISAGLILNGILIVHAGFVIAGTLLFVLAARGFGSTQYVKNAIIGLVIAAVTYSFFTFGLGLALPKGVMPV
ncbi:MAG: tripartite tricarboxylate transporter TctB family protein [Burkholderiales bacterium]|jgi:putative tricarboxylic transport membrane protein